MNGILDRLPKNIRGKMRKMQQPAWMEPMLATLTDRRFSAEDWIYERKLDGERCLTFRNENSTSLMSRNQKVLNARYPELVSALEKQAVTRFILDGEIVAFEGSDTSFARLQERMHLQDEEKVRQSKVDVYYYVFDILYLDGYNLTQVHLRQRKWLLKRALSFKDPLRYMSHRNAEGLEFFKQACKKGWEGIIAKQADSTYMHSRSNSWLKFKCGNRQELVIGGYTEPHGKRIALGALLLGFYQDGKLVYAGKVGTGFDDETLKSLHALLASRELSSSPFDQGKPPTKEVHWVKPQLVAEIGFEEWTEDGRLRHPRYLGLRTDKDPRDVVREEAAV